MTGIPPHILLEREILEENVEGVKKALDDGASPDGQNDAAKKPLHYAVEVRSLAIIEMLCEKGVSLDVPNTDDNGNTALHIATNRNNEDAVRLLLDKGADPNAKNNMGQTALHLATTIDNKKIVALLLEKGIDPNLADANNIVAMQIATRTASTPILELLKGGGCPLDFLTEDGSTLLHLAAKFGNLETVKWLVQNGANTEVLNQHGLTAAAVAETEEQVHVVQWLAGRKDNKKAKLPEACDFIEDLRKLSLEGKDLNAPYTEGYGQGSCPLHLAAEAGYKDVVDYLINENVDVNVKCSKGMTALHLASWGGHVKIVQKLIIAGCDAAAQDDEGNTAFHLASTGGHLQTMQLLYHEANPESRTGDGKTALHLAAEYGNLKAVRWLLGKDFDPNVRDGSDCTPVDYARKERNTKIHEYLLRWRHYMQEKSSVRKYEVENERLRRTQVQQRAEIERMKSEIEKLKRENQVLSAIIPTPERAVAE